MIGFPRIDKNGKRHPLHRLWLNIRSRCNNPRHPDYKYYGGRGIEVCDRWDSYAVFVADVGEHPGLGWTLDRVDNNDHYAPDNVRWATRKVQARNRNYCKLTAKQVSAIRRAYKYGNGAGLARKYGVSQSIISHIICGRAWQ